MGTMNNEIELCIKNLKIFSVIGMLFEDNKVISGNILEITKEITKMNTVMTEVQKATKSICTEFK